MAKQQTAITAQMLARFVPISELSAGHREELAEHCELLKLEKGELITGDESLADVLLYVAKGQLRVSGGDYPQEVIRAEDLKARFAIPGMDTPGRQATAISAAELLQVNRAKASTLLMWSHSNAGADAEHIHARERADITALLLDCDYFAQVPHRHLQEVAECIERIDARAGEDILRRGEAGKHYYIVQDGMCEVLREGNHGVEVAVARLLPGSTFGEESLLTGSPRNASVRMLSDGSLLRLSLEHFMRLIATPLLNHISHERAEDLIALGARWLDVRTAQEFTANALDNAINLPLTQLREGVKQLQPSVSYVTYCDSGQRAQAAAFLLAQRGFNVCCLRTGIARERPHVRHVPGLEQSLPSLHAELARADAALEGAIQDAAAANAERAVHVERRARSREHPQIERQLDQAFAKARHAAARLEQIKAHKLALDRKAREAEAEAASRRRVAEAQCEQMRRATQALLEQEKQRLAAHYREASSRLRAIDEARNLAEQRFQSEQQRLVEELDKVRTRIDTEAKRIRGNLEQVRREAEDKAEKIRAQHIADEQLLQRETEQALAQERERLEQEIARSIEAQELARQHLETTEQERARAQLQASQRRQEAELEQRAREERERLAREAHSERFRERRAAAVSRLEQARKSREEAQQRRAEFSSSIRKATADSDTPAANNNDAPGYVRVDGDSGADDAAAVAAAVAARTRQQEEELRLKLYEEMEQFISEEEEKSNRELEDAARYSEQLDRIQQDKERRRMESERNTASMFEELQQFMHDAEPSDPTDAFARQRLAAEEKARLVRSARIQAAERTRLARDAVGSSSEDDSP